jgi:hypothetical protein
MNDTRPSVVTTKDLRDPGHSFRRGDSYSIPLQTDNQLGFRLPNLNSHHNCVEALFDRQRPMNTVRFEYSHPPLSLSQRIAEVLEEQGKRDDELLFCEM